MDDLLEKKREFVMREKQYYKPHFGPEENDIILNMEIDRIKN
jgi:hypothetical protein